MHDMTPERTYQVKVSEYTASVTQHQMQVGVCSPHLANLDEFTPQKDASQEQPSQCNQGVIYSPSAISHLRAVAMRKAWMR